MVENKLKKIAAYALTIFFSCVPRQGCSCCLNEDDDPEGISDLERERLYLNFILFMEFIYFVTT
jgi:hypothetical protein